MKTRAHIITATTLLLIASPAASAQEASPGNPPPQGRGLDRFAWIGAFSSAPNTRPPAELVPDPAVLKAKVKLLYLSCGNKDGLIRISQDVHGYLKQHDIPHIWNVDDEGHTPRTWASNLYHFAQRIFR